MQNFFGYEIKNSKLIYCLELEYIYSRSDFRKLCMINGKERLKEIIIRRSTFF